MSTVLSPDQEAVLAAAVSQGMFSNTTQALDEAIRMLRQSLVIDAALSAGLASGEPIEVTDEYWAAKREEIIRQYEARQR